MEELNPTEWLQQHLEGGENLLKQYENNRDAAKTVACQYHECYMNAEPDSENERSAQARMVIFQALYTYYEVALRFFDEFEATIKEAIDDKSSE